MSRKTPTPFRVTKVFPQQPGSCNIPRSQSDQEPIIIKAVHVSVQMSVINELKQFCNASVTTKLNQIDIISYLPHLFGLLCKDPQGSGVPEPKYHEELNTLFATVVAYLSPSGMLDMLNSVFMWHRTRKTLILAELTRSLKIIFGQIFGSNEAQRRLWSIYQEDEAIKLQIKHPSGLLRYMMVGRSC